MMAQASLLSVESFTSSISNFSSPKSEESLQKEGKRNSIDSITSLTFETRSIEKEATLDNIVRYDILKESTRLMANRKFQNKVKEQNIFKKTERQSNYKKKNSDPTNPTSVLEY